MDNKNVSPFGNYGICITDIRESRVCKTDMTKIKEADYLFQRGCSFDVYKWNDDKGYEKVLQYDGKDFSKASSKGNPLFPMHIWHNELEDLQKWLGVYYDAAIACMIAPETKKFKTSDINEESLNELFKKQMPIITPYKKTDDDKWGDVIGDYEKIWKDSTWKDSTWTTSYTSNIEN